MLGNIGSHVDLTSSRVGTSSKGSEGSSIPSSSPRSSEPFTDRQCLVCWCEGDFASYRVRGSVQMRLSPFGRSNPNLRRLSLTPPGRATTPEPISTPALLQIFIRPLQAPTVSIGNVFGFAQPVRFARIHHKFCRHVVALQAPVEHLALGNGSVVSASPCRIRVGVLAFLMNVMGEDFWNPARFS